MAENNMFENAALKIKGLTILEPLKAIILFFVSSVIAIVICVVTGIYFGIYDSLSLSYIGEALGGGGVIWYLYFYKQKYTLAQLGYTKPKNSLLHLIWQIPLMIFFSLAGAIIAGVFLHITPGSQPNTFATNPEITITTIDWVILFLGFLVGVTIIPFIEEFIFRKLVTDILSKYMGPFLVIVVNSFIFALAHIDVTRMMYIFFLGLFCNLLYYHQRSLWPSMLFHATNNLFVMLILLYRICS